MGTETLEQPKAAASVINFRNNTECIAEYKRVRYIVFKRLLPTAGLDREGLVSELVFDEYQRNERFGPQLINYRCTDALRKLRSEHRRNEGRTANPRLFVTPHEELEREVAELVRSASLTTNERLIIYHFYYRGLNIIQAGYQLSLDPDEARHVLDSAIEKLKRVVRASND